MLLWCAAVFAGIARPGGATSVVVGYAHGEAWLVNAIIFPDGVIIARYYADNLGRHRTLHLKFSNADRQSLRSWRYLAPTSQPSRVATTYAWHMAAPAIPAAMLAMYWGLSPWVRKWYRRRHGLCLRCGYDLRGNESGRCSECGTES